VGRRRVLIRNAEIAGDVLDLRLANERVAEIGRALEAHDGPVRDARGAALLPGLHDHHIHLRSLAASLSSVRCGPPAVEDVAGLTGALGESSPRDGWIRGAGYFESVAGDLDRARLDAIRDDVPIRIQHRSGVMWFLNSLACEALGLDDGDAPATERDDRGRSTGRLFRADAWLRERVPSTRSPDLAVVGRCLARRGITRVTDCTPTNADEDFAAFGTAHASGALPQKVEVMGQLGLGHVGATARVGAHKIMLDEPALPDLGALTALIRQAHDEARAVAFHVVTRAELHFALAALEDAGPRDGDRLEHASVAPVEALETIREMGLRVVTQPNFVHERGDAYLEDVAPRDQRVLYRVKSWLDAGVCLRFGTDAPFGEPDPWAALEAAVERRTRRGVVLGGDERVDPETALARFLPDADTAAPGPPRLREGDAADLCLLDRSWADARRALSAVEVQATWVDGTPVQTADDASSA